jgi:hypothetical protein
VFVSDQSGKRTKILFRHWRKPPRKNNLFAFRPVGNEKINKKSRKKAGKKQEKSRKKAGKIFFKHQKKIKFAKRTKSVTQLRKHDQTEF